MRFLPRTPRRIWLLAGLVWLAGVWICWRPAPPVLRFVVEPVETPVMWLSEDGQRILHYYPGGPRPLWFGNKWQPDTEYPYRAFDLMTGARIASSEPTDDGVALIPEQGLLIVRERPGGTSPYSLVELSSGEREPLTWPNIEDSEPLAARATADGQFVVIVSRLLGELETIWWDRTARTARIFPGLEPVAMATNGRWLTHGDRPDEYCVREPKSDSIVCRIIARGSFWSVEFDRGGERVLFRVNGTNGDFECELFDGNDGRKLVGTARYNVCFGDIKSSQFVGLDVWDPDLVLGLHEIPTGVRMRNQSIRGYGPSCRQKEVWSSVFDRFLLVNWCVGSSSAFGRFIANVPLIANYYDGDAIDYFAIVDTQTFDVVSHFSLPHAYEKRLSPDGRSLLIRNSSDDRWHLWDVPPRNSRARIGWMIGWIGLIAILAVWCIRRLTHRLPQLGFGVSSVTSDRFAAVRSGRGR